MLNVKYPLVRLISVSESAVFMKCREGLAQWAYREKLVVVQAWESSR